MRVLPVTLTLMLMFVRCVPRFDPAEGVTMIAAEPEAGDALVATSVVVELNLMSETGINATSTSRTKLIIQHS